jgi:hypothetical protein
MDLHEVVERRILSQGCGSTWRPVEKKFILNRDESEGDSPV